jgi:hypothetical protein
MFSHWRPGSVALFALAYAATHPPAFVRSRIAPYARRVGRAARRLRRWRGRPGEVKLVRCVSPCCGPNGWRPLLAFPRIHAPSTRTAIHIPRVFFSRPGRLADATLSWAEEDLPIFGLGDDEDLDDVNDDGAALADARQMAEGGTGEERIPLRPSPSPRAGYGAMGR